MVMLDFNLEIRHVGISINARLPTTPAAPIVGCPLGEFTLRIAAFSDDQFL